MRYKYIDHTADIGFEIYGKDLRELFKNAAIAIFDSITELKEIEKSKRRKVEIRSETLEELFLDWLRELLFIFSTEFLIPRETKIITLKDRKLEAELLGENFDPKRHRIKIEIKNPTYHMFYFKKTNKGYVARVIFDT